MSNGFRRLRGITAVGVLGAGAFAGAGTARAASQVSGFTHGVTTSVSSRIVSWLWVGNQNAYALATSSSPGSKTVTTSMGFNLTPSAWAFGISDASLTISGGEWYTDAFDSALVLSVNGNLFVNPGGIVDVTGSTITSSVQSNITPGVDAQVQYYFAPGDSVVRAVYSLTNTTVAEIRTCALVGTDLGSDQNTTIQDSSDGDRLNENSDYWIVTSDQPAGMEPQNFWDPVVSIGRYGQGAPIAPINGVRPEVASGPDRIKGYVGLGYGVDIPAGSTIRIMTFIGLNESNAQASASAGNFSSITAANTAGLLTGLSGTELQEIINYGDYTGSGVGNSACGVAQTEPANGGGGGGGGLLSLTTLLSGVLVLMLSGVRRVMGRRA